jgi:uncharacterized protein (TIGR02001 family)
MVGLISRQGAFATLCLSGVVLAGSAGAADLGARKRLPAEAVPPVIESVVADFIFGARLQSDYNFRGISQSNRDPSAQSYFELQLFDNFLYGGFATYKVDLPTRPGAEIDLTAGIRPKFGPVNFDFGIIYYYYPRERPLVDLTSQTFLTPANSDFLEFAGKASYTYQEALTVGANAFHAYDWLGTGADATYASGTVKYAFPEGTFGILPAGFALSAEFGHYFFGKTSQRFGRVQLPDYNYGNVGLSYTFGIATIDVRYHDTDLSKRDCFTLTTDPRGVFSGSGRSNWCSSAVVGTLSLDFTTAALKGVFEPARAAPPKEADARGQAIR